MVVKYSNMLARCGVPFVEFNEFENDAVDYFQERYCCFMAQSDRMIPSYWHVRLSFADG